VRAGEEVQLPDGVRLRVVAPHPDGQYRLWRSEVCLEGGVEQYLQRVGRPIRYSYVPQPLPIGRYQTVFAHDLGSAEMPSAGRPFSRRLVTELAVGGVVIAPITLHTGVSSQEDGEPPQAERFSVPPTTAELVNLTRRQGRRVVAVGTTVTRALESAVSADRTVQAASGWTDLVLGPSRPAQVVTGLVTGWHAPGASHLQLLEAVAGADLVTRAYAEALRERYLWHEFGDSCLLLP
jgi:S-adenosylmethionine:tRNA ribosyltransferase-isomerase